MVRLAGAGPHRTSWPAYLVDAVLAVAVLLVTLRATDGGESVTIRLPDEGAQHLIFLAAAAAFAARTFPYPALAVAVVLDTLPYWLPMGGAGYHLSVMIALYSVVAYTRGRRGIVVAVAVLILQVVLMAWERDWLWTSMYVATAAFSDAVPIAFGLAARSRAVAAAALAQRALDAERSRDATARQLLAEDRLRTARDLHDSVAHQIAVMNLNAGLATRALGERPDDAATALRTVRDAGRAVIASIHELLTGLREGSPADAEPGHDVADLRRLTDGFRNLVPGLSVSYDGPEAPGMRRVSPVLYAVVREALTNAYKHGRHDAPVSIRIRFGDRSSQVKVTNSTAVTKDAAVSGFGLRGMRERVADAGGTLTVEHKSNNFVLVAEIPEPGGES